MEEKIKEPKVPLVEPKTSSKSENEILKNLKKMSPMQMFSVVSMLLIGLTLPVTIFMALSPISPIITPATGPVSPPESPTPQVIGNMPVIITTELKPAGVGKQYRQVVEGYDIDTGDELNLQADGLPSGLTLDQCHSNVRKVNGISENKINYISCTISGRTELYGDFPVSLTLIDGFNYAQKTLNLRIQ